MQLFGIDSTTWGLSSVPSYSILISFLVFSFLSFNLIPAGLAERTRHRLRVPLVVNRVGSMLCPFLSAKPVRGFADVMNSDRKRWNGFFHAMLERGVFLPPSPFETWFLSTAHDEAALDRAADALGQAFAAI